jgi:glycosyltransferase involved in cell wall biosynthesis
MNIVYNRESLKVISVFDHPISSDSEDNILSKMFPVNHASLALWKINKKINCIPVHLKVRLDKDLLPESLHFRDKEIYRRTEEDKKIQKDKHSKDLITSNGIVLGKALSEFLIKSPYTKKKTAEDLSNGLVPYQHAIPVTWKGYFKIATGYSAIGRNILFRLHNYGIFAKPEYLPSHSDLDPLYLSYLSKYDSLRFSSNHKHQIKILSHTPLCDSFRGRKIIYTMMETETLHPDFVNMCNQYNEVWVPCKHNLNLFVSHGIRVPVHVIPLGVDERFYFDKNDEKVNVEDGLLPLLGSGLKKFKFVALFQWYSRKCPHILIKSFVNAFSDKDDVSLIIVNHHGDPSGIFKEVQKYAADIKKSNYPSIFLYNHIPTDKQLPSVYKFCDAFVSTSRGEGFSLPHIEAAACGLPVISAHHTAMKDYLNDDNSYLVKMTKKEVCPPDLSAACGWYGGQLFNVMGKEEVGLFSDCMRSVVENYGEAKTKAKRLQDMVRDNYTWDITTSMVARRIRER